MDNLNELQVARVREIVREEIDAHTRVVAQTLLPSRRPAVDPLGKQEDRIPDGAVLGAEGLGAGVSAELLDLVDHRVVKGADLLDNGVAHDDSSSLGPDVAASGSNPTVEAAGDASSVDDSSAGRVTENPEEPPPT